jgi:predicted HicB family RNase H-like nuclease
MTKTYGGDLMADMNLRDVPEDLHRKAKAEAALEGISLKALVIKALEEYLKKKKR